ncbi:cyclopropane-fatty-acyl-phospholipid synthase family protein [Thalassococcus sp. S3]|uniref:SAM-dependent methyltransferase n=1 Tax=Thalassococcus sp. S3 TaxID=2017482 RepID=UPI0010240EB1|nr:cyclopropane-fatty-acyl-phospholipid synthase family protein [Thalassococcus sp. S3]QBF34006.1 SAM-dependent methyltransferase [Thalassococcus sp. S3]
MTLIDPIPLPAQDAQLLTAENRKALTRHLPAMVRQALGILTTLEYGTLDIALPGGACFRIETSTPQPSADITIRSYDFIAKAIRRGDIGVAEGFMDAEWSSTDLTRFLELFCYNAHLIHERIDSNPIARLMLRFQHWLNRNTKTQARRNIAAHYDLGNPFYELWLDPSMTYSSALYQTGAEDLETAQRAKYAALADAVRVQPGERVLEIGCGWGGFAAYLAKERGAQVTGLTISQEQLEFGRAHIERLGLAGLVDLQLRDYRAEDGKYDRIVSVEMFEAVGEAYWPDFFDMLARCLKPGGRAGLQVITIQEKYFEHYRRGTDFIQHYVFPGGMLPTPTHLRTLGHEAGLDQISERVFGESYARTLSEWRAAFLQNWDEIAPMGFDDRFKRLWLYYFHYCEAGFRAGNIDVRQVIYDHAQN